MVYKYDFSVFGDTLYPEKIINRIKGNFIVESCFSSTDNKFHNSSDKYGYGGVSFWHPLQFSTEDEIVRNVAAAYLQNDQTMSSNINSVTDTMEGFNGQ